MTLEFIAEMAWKSAAIAGVAHVILTLLRSRSAADRASVVRLAVVMLLVLPIVSLGLPALQVERPEPRVVELLPPDPTPMMVEPVRTLPILERPAATPLVVSPPSPSHEVPIGTLLPIGYAVGAVLLLGRLLAGLWTLRRWTAVAEPVGAPVWTAALRRAAGGAGVAKPVKLVASDDVPSPMSWGLAHPVILIDFDTLARPEDADAVLAHEMAHVVRRDWAMLMLSRLAVVLFWFNPLVWLLERALVEQAEEAADLRAVSSVEPVDYARTLVACGVQAGGVLLPANSIAAGGGLARRVRAVLDEQRRLTPSGSAWTGAAMLACVIISAPIAALELVAAQPPTAPTPPTAPHVARPPQAPVAPAPPDVPSAPLSPFEFAQAGPADFADIDTAVEAAVATELTPTRLAAVEAPAEPAVVRTVAVGAAVSQAAAQAEGIISATAAARASIDVDDLISMRVHGVDTAYLAELAAVAPRLRLSADEVVEAKIHGLTPRRMREFADLGYGASDIDQLVAMQIHGVSPNFIREMAAAGYRGVNADDLVAMRIHGVTAERARRAAANGRRPTAEELIEMSIHGKL